MALSVEEKKHEVNNMTFGEEVKVHVKKSQVSEENVRKAFSLTVGQCTDCDIFVFVENVI